MTKRNENRTIDVRRVCHDPSYPCIHLWQLLALLTLLVSPEMLLETQTQTQKSLDIRYHRVCLFVVCFPGVTTHCGCIFTARVAGFSLLVFEVS
jgi:hypothetical protein